MEIPPLELPPLGWKQQQAPDNQQEMIPEAVFRPVIQPAPEVLPPEPSLPPDEEEL